MDEILSNKEVEELSKAAIAVHRLIDGTGDVMRTAAARVRKVVPAIEQSAHGFVDRVDDFAEKKTTRARRRLAVNFARAAERVGDTSLAQSLAAKLEKRSNFENHACKLIDAVASHLEKLIQGQNHDGYQSYSFARDWTLLNNMVDTKTGQIKPKSDLGRYFFDRFKNLPRLLRDEELKPGYRRFGAFPIEAWQFKEIFTEPFLKHCASPEEAADIRDALSREGDKPVTTIRLNQEIERPSKRGSYSLATTVAALFAMIALLPETLGGASSETTEHHFSGQNLASGVTSVASHPDSRTNTLSLHRAPNQ